MCITTRDISNVKEKYIMPNPFRFQHNTFLQQNAAIGYKQCPNCGAPMKLDARICPKCGGYGKKNGPEETIRKNYLKTILILVGFVLFIAGLFVISSL